MSVRVYGQSTLVHPAWQSHKAYGLLSFVIPTVPNSYAYECTGSGISGSNEPLWPVIIGQTVVDGDPLQLNPVTWTCRALIAPNPLIVDLETGGLGGYPYKDVWVKSSRPFASGKDTFFVYGSHDGSNWRQIDELEAPQNANKADRHKGFINSYRFMRVKVDSQYECEIEIVAGV